MKVLHIQKVAGIAGSENHLLTLLPKLKQGGCEPYMLVLADQEDKPEEFVHRMGAAGVPTDVLRFEDDVSPSLLVRLWQYLRARSFDVIHTHLYHADLYGALAARMAGHRRIVSTKHGFNPWQLDRRYTLLARLAACFQKRTVVISDALGDWLANKVYLPRERMRRIHYAFDRQQFRLNGTGPAVTDLPPRPIIGTVGRLLEQKGIHVLLDAFAKYLGVHPTGTLVIAGDGPARQALEDQSRRLGISDRVRFLGHVPHGHLRSWVEEFDIFAFPSFGEGFGLVLVEAMACGKPVIASNALAIPEIVKHQETGLLIPAGDHFALADGLLTLVQDQALRRRFGVAGRKRVERTFTVERMVMETLCLYEEVVHEPVEA